MGEILEGVPDEDFVCPEGGLRQLMEEITGKQVDKTSGPEMDSSMRKGCTWSLQTSAEQESQEGRAVLEHQLHKHKVQLKRQNQPGKHGETVLVPERLKKDN